MTEPRRVFYYRVEHLDYPRNARIRRYLRSAGDEVVVGERAVGSTLRRTLADLRLAFTGSRGADMVVVSEMSLPFVAPAWLASRLSRAVLVVDGFVGKYETDIVDHRLHRPGSLQAGVRRVIDRVAVGLADLYLVDTEMRAAAIRRRHRRARVLSLPVGAPDWARPQPLTPARELRVLFYGSFLPLHGVPTIVRAMHALRDLDISLTLVGSAPHRGGTDDIRRLVDDLDVGDRVAFRPSVPQERLAELIAEHDVVLGLFGGSEKAQSVIANKVWQGLSAGRVVVTQRSAALAEIAPIVGDQLRTVPPADPDALAGALRELESRRPSAYPGSRDPLEQYVQRAFGALHRSARL